MRRKKVLLPVLSLTVILLTANFNILFDLVLRPDVPYLDRTHLTAGMFTASFTAILIGLLRIRKDVKHHRLQRRRSEAALGIFRSIFEESPIGIELYDSGGRLIEANKACLDILGISDLDEMLGFELFKNPNVPGEIKQRSFRGETVRYEIPFDFEKIKKHKLYETSKSGIIYLDVLMSPLHAEEEKSISGYLLQIEDITEQKRMEEALRESEERFKQVAESAGEWIWEVDADGLYTYASPVVEKMLGYKPEELVGKKHFYDLFAPDVRDRLRHAAFEAFARKEVFRNFPNPNVHKQGHTVILETSGLPVLDAGGNLLGYRGADTDITERKQAEEVLHRASAYMRSLIEASIDSLVTINPEGKITDVNEATVKVTGVAREELIGTDFSDYFTEPEKAHNGYRKVLFKRCVLDYPLTIRHRKTGKLTPVLCNAAVYRDETGKIRGIFAAARNITELKKAKEALQKAHDEMEQRVKERTADLVQASERLQLELAQRKRAEEKIQLHLHRLAALHKIDIAISGSLDLGLSLDVLIGQLITQLGIHAADVLQLNPHTQMLEYAAGKGFRTRALQHTRLRLGEGHAGLAALERRLVSIPNLAEVQNGLRRSPLFPSENFVSYYCLPLIAKGQVKGVLEIFHRTLLDPDPDWLDFLATLATQAAIALDNTELFEGLQRSNIELRLAYDATLEGWSRALDMRDKQTEGHTQRVTEMTLRMAGRMGIKDEEVAHLRRGALLHDIGKMAIPDSILLKPGPFSDEEWEVMRQHPLYAYRLLSPITFLRPALDIPYCHHEKWDGTGYPRGLKGEEIPLAARIFAVADVWDALRSDRPYRAAWPAEKVYAHIRSLAGAHFDPKVLEIFFDIEW